MLISFCATSVYYYSLPLFKEKNIYDTQTSIVFIQILSVARATVCKTFEISLSSKKKKIHLSNKTQASLARVSENVTN